MGFFGTRLRRPGHRGSAEGRGAFDPIERALAAAAARYAGLHPRFRWYARVKYRMDPCYRAIARRIGEDSFTVDLGTGLGMLPVLLGELGVNDAAYSRLLAAGAVCEGAITTPESGEQ